MCSFHDKSLVIITPSSFALLTTSSWLPFTRIGWNSDYFLVKEILSSFHFSLFSWTLLSRDHWGTQSAICCALLVPPLATYFWRCGAKYYYCRALFTELFLTQARLKKVVKVSYNVAFPTVSATFQIFWKLFPVHRLLLSWLVVNDSSKYFKSQ